MATMRAVVHTRYGPPEVLRVAEVERPEPRPDEVLVRVVATTVNRTDCGFRDPRPPFVRLFSGLRRPKHLVLGTELEVGDEVFGVNADRFGANAEYVCVRERAPIAPKPASLGFEEAAAVGDGGILALSCLRGSDLGPGRRILVYGASGAIGSAGVQLARAAGADVTAVCDGRHVEVVSSLGADRVVDYERDGPLPAGERYDVIFDAVGKLSFRRCRPSLLPRGQYLSTDLGPGWQNPLLHLVTAPLPMRKAKLPLPRYTKANLVRLAELVDAGRFRPVIDRCVPLEEVVEATRYVETGQKTGNVVLTVAPTSS
jgi:NADPH:quinone reductase-like Zn-dependent oxidoreductase